MENYNQKAQALKFMNTITSDFLSATKSEICNKNDLFIQQVRNSKIWKGL